MRHSGQASQRLTKRALVTVSHAIERAALATAEDGPLVVLALFQRMPYFARERALYERISRRAAVTVVGVVGQSFGESPVGAYPVDLAETEDLAREWTVVALTPRFGAALVAYDRAEVAPDATTLEAGRLFDGDWSFRRDDALHEVVRLRDQLADRLPPAARTAIDHTLDRVRDVPPAPGETRAQAAIQLLADRVERARRVAPPADETGPLLDVPGLRRWTGVDGVTASGTLPVALVAVRVQEPAGAPARLGRRGVARETQAVIAALTGALRPVDRAVRLAPHDYLLVLPALDETGALAVASEVRARVEALARSYPFVTFAVHAAVGVSDRRPLPVGEVRRALDWAVRERVPVATVSPQVATAVG
ncbi:Diguanylate Cyclase and Two-component system sensory domain-containing protein [Micromonospora nigra]|uniref:Diguanylate Cyclase and Two-component system sensory domain-containing protein n=1 Tax=Micromonospora nigra TaxID=145857 RepID=A0A1C6T200_9ACTN|nr:DICT sensory domain-containing protein [Micromonospora nigra]SCL35375.1 Diguanylate Cyclase and Two-component system sensory domain-containing protein [Micromonospora nigra]